MHGTLVHETDERVREERAGVRAVGMSVCRSVCACVRDVGASEGEV